MQKDSIVLFLVIGTLSAIVYFICFTFCYKILLVDYQIAVSISYVLSVLTHFVGNRVITFKSYTNISKQIIKYVILVGVNYIITFIIMYFIVAKCLLSPYLGIIFSIAVTFSVGYGMSKYWIFKKSKI